MATPMNLTTSSDEEAQVHRSTQPKRLSPAMLFAGAAGVAAAVLLACHAAGSMSRAAPQSMTVRALLESDELAGVMTHNIMAFSGDADQEHVQRRVVAGLGEIRDAIREQQPAAHEKMGSLTLSPTQKQAAMRVLKMYSDSRMLSLTHKVAAAVRETAQEKGDQSVLARKLAELLTPSLSDMRQLHKEMFPGAKDEFNLDLDGVPALELVGHEAASQGDVPGAKDEFNLDLDGVPALKHWNGELKVDLSRRLSADNGDVQSQAHTLFQGLERELGDEMPNAPGRMLLDLSSSPSSTPVADASFMDCVMKAVPNPMKVAS
eukprot:CAMPEP_0183604168 /NCGR_PEP_ID=MMETSP0371-20130417/181812_1 /TAXON_ID=268820 /ORGANISM="Peridinium aciculiferum, Strain PAER-2" /LENGTH=318 /DNA_ID=CAMNT_0025816265 /DNA_START=32 /DNA_END=986 /DNA_ORIENTATION=+